MDRVYRKQRRVFAPSWLMTILTAALCLAFIGLGRWQWHRGNERERQWDSFARGADEARPVGSTGLGALQRFQRVTLTGRYDTAHQFLLDNRSHEGQPGYEVLTPFKLEGGALILIDRGWLSFTGVHARLPEIAFDGGGGGEVTLMGRLDDLPAAGLKLGRAGPSGDASWPKLTSFPTLGQLAAALGRPLEPRIVLLDPREPYGYLRDWHPPGLAPMRHWSYAVQWWCFAATTLILWLILSWRKMT